MSVSDRYALGHAGMAGRLSDPCPVVLSVGITSLHDDSPAARDGAISVLPGEVVRAAGRRNRCTAGGLLALPLPSRVGLCLECSWLDTQANEEATAQHTRSTAHPTIYRPMPTLGNGA